MDYRVLYSFNADKVRNMIWKEFLLFVACSKVNKNNTRKLHLQK